MEKVSCARRAAGSWRVSGGRSTRRAAGLVLAGLLGVMLGTAAPADAQGPKIVITDDSVFEGDSGTVKAHFDVSVHFDNPPTMCQDNDPDCSARTLRICLDYVTSTEGGTATASPATAPDFLSAIGSIDKTVTLSGGEIETPVASIDIDVVGDSVDEADETFKVRIAQSSTCPVTASLPDSEAVGTIEDDDGVVAAPSVEIAINDVTIREGDQGNRAVAFTVSLSRPVKSIVSVSYRSVDGTASGAAQLSGDYLPVQGSVTFKRFQTSRTIEVPVRGDAANEPNETFRVELEKPVGAAIVDGSGLGTVVDDD